MNRPSAGLDWPPENRPLAPGCRSDENGSCDEFERLARQVNTHILNPCKNGQSDPLHVQERTQLGD